MANTFNLGNKKWAVKKDQVLAYNSENNNFKPLPFDFSRASTATVVNKSGLIEEVGQDEPRIDFLNDTDGHLLLEPSRTNLQDYSEDGSQWSIIQATLSSTTDSTSPSGQSSVYKVTDNTVSGQHRANVVVAVTSGNDYTFSVFVKKESNSDVDFVYLLFSSQFATTRYFYNISEGTSLDSGGNIENYGNGWYRLSATATATSTGNGVFGINLTDANNNNTYTGTGNGSMLIWGIQVEEDSYPTSYIPTNGSSVTRVAEACTGAGLDSIFSEESGGSLYLEIEGLADDGTSRGIALSDGTTTDSVYVVLSNVSNRIAYYIRANASIIFGKNFQKTTGLDINQTENHKIALRYKTGDSSWAMDGEITQLTSGLDASFSFNDNISELNLSRGSGTLAPFYGKIKEIKVYNTGLTDAELIALTS